MAKASNHMERIARRHLFNESHEVHGRAFIGVVGNGAYDRERNAELVTHLGHRGAFHFNRKQIRQTLFQLKQPRTAADKFIAAGDQAMMQTRLHMPEFFPVNRVYGRLKILAEKVPSSHGKPR